MSPRRRRSKSPSGRVFPSLSAPPVKTTTPTFTRCPEPEFSSKGEWRGPCSVTAGVALPFNWAPVRAAGWGNCRAVGEAFAAGVEKCRGVAQAAMFVQYWNPATATAKTAPPARLGPRGV